MAELKMKLKDGAYECDVEQTISFAEWVAMNDILVGKPYKSPDSNVEKNREMLLQRSIVGLAKYGVTTDNNPLPLRAWLQHALEEALDMANYLQAAISKLDNEGN